MNLSNPIKQWGIKLFAAFLVLFFLAFLFTKKHTLLRKFNIPVSVNSKFIDVTESAGVRKVKTAGPDDPSSLATPGAAWGDYNNDGNIDLLVLTLDSEEPNYLYKNNGDGTFTDVTTEAGLFYEGTSWGAAFADYNNDGYLDLYLTNFGELKDQEITESNILYKNNGDGTFTEVTTEAGVSGSGHSTGPAWGDYNNDGFIDLYVPNYGCFGECVGEINNFYKNNGDGTFTDIAREIGIADIPGKNLPPENVPKRSSHSFQAIFFDYNNDNYPDLFIATDFGTSPLYKNNGDGTFTDVTNDVGLNVYGTGMGVAVADYNNDNYLDFYVTNDGANYFWENQGGKTFVDIAGKLNLQDEIAQGWGVNLFDYDNDSDFDLQIINGADITQEFRSYDVFYENKRGKFTNVSEEVGIKNNKLSMGSAWGDYDNDGFIDVYITSYHGKNTLFRNQTNKNNWIKVKLEGKEVNKAGIGSKVKVKTKDKTQMQQVLSGSSFLSQNSLVLTFGLGKNTNVEEIVVLWPNGKKQVVVNPDINKLIEIKEE